MISSLLSFFVGMLVFYFVHKIRLGGFESLSAQILQAAEKKAAEKMTSLELSLQQKELEHKKHLEKLSETFFQKNAQEKERLQKKEDLLDQRSLYIEKEVGKTEDLKRELSKEKSLFLERNLSLQEKEKQLVVELERISQMDISSAKKLLLEKTENEMQQELADLECQLSSEIESEAEVKAKKILVQALQRLSDSTISEAAQTTVPIPNEEMKKRIIGREGRNIRSLEYATGVNFIVDDTPGAIVISGFDPVRKEIAKLSLKELIKDGRIHPIRIEEVVYEMQERIEKEIENIGLSAASKAGVYPLKRELLKLLGKLQLLYTHGQNVLQHSLEVSFLMGMLAEELELDVKLAKRIGLLHDIGKAISHETEGTHATIGQSVALKYGENKWVANGIGSHHEEMLPETLEASLCPIANKISAQRPGSRIEALDQYVKRVKKLEAISSQFEGIEKVYALHTGKEIRVIVKPDSFDDATVSLLAKKIAQKIEKELSYPGKIKVTVIREKKVVEYAS